MIPWKEEYNIGVQEIDVQHRHFLQLLSDLHDVFITGQDSDGKLEEILSELIKYTETHFATEEKYFDQFGYEDAECHKEEHRKLKQEVEIFSERYAKEGVGMLIDFMDFMENWLVKHLNSEDKKYVQCFHEHGLI